ncbi:MAG TPA: EamA family transporter [Chitinophagaceae bacterium]|nr:EamA family transporter [Chitinophagaceae bacterium]
MQSTKPFTWIATGLAFSLLWSSAATATRVGLQSAQPLVIAQVRFAMASFLLLALAHGIYRKRLPAGREWRQLAIYGLLNITLYLGVYVIAMQTVSAGIGTLAVAANPVIIGFFSVLFLRKPLTPALVLSMGVCLGGVLVAAWPLLGGAAVRVTPRGLGLLLGSMLAYSAGAIYFSASNWNGLSLLAINGWQTLFGGLFLLPFSALLYRPESNHLGAGFWAAVSWLAFPVSILAVQLWLWLLRAHPVRAGLWLFLCPAFGFLLAALVLREPVSGYTLTGMALVLGGLLIARREATRGRSPA